MRKLLILSSLLLSLSSLYAIPEHYLRGYESNYWILEGKQQKKQKKQKEEVFSKDPNLSHAEKLERFQKIFKEAQAAAILNPKNEKLVLRFEKLKRMAIKKAEDYKNTFQKLLLSHPELSGLIENPVVLQKI